VCFIPSECFKATTSGFSHQHFLGAVNVVMGTAKKKSNMDTLKKRVGEGEVKFVTSAFSTTHMYDFLYEYGFFVFVLKDA